MDLHAYNMFKCGGNFLLNSSTDGNDTGSIFYYQIEISRNSVLFDQKGNSLPGYLAPQPARPLLMRLGHTYHSRYFQRRVGYNGRKYLRRNSYNSQCFI